MTSPEPAENPDWRAIGDKLRNWGRWGPHDERGTLNHITPERLVAAASLVQRGVAFDLGIPLAADGPMPGTIRNNPLHLMTQTAGTMGDGDFRYTDDYVVMALQSASQWDALSHVFYDDKLWNGYPASSVTAAGASHASIDKATGLVGRGVLLDVARRRDVDWLQPGEVISARELQESADEQDVEMRGGDILLIRTGWWKNFLTYRDPVAWVSGAPGIGLDSCQWLYDNDVAAIGSDNFGIEALPGEVDGEIYPVHMVMIRDVGMMFAEILDLEALAEDCAQDGRYEFLLSAAPLRFAGAVGSPINPLALK